MKTPEKALEEWALDEIGFDWRNGSEKWSRENFENFVSACHSPEEQITIRGQGSETGRKYGTTIHPTGNVLDTDRASMIRGICTSLGIRLTTKDFLRFHDLKEVHTFVGDLYQREHSEAPIEVVPGDLARKFRTTGSI